MEGLKGRIKDFLQKNRWAALVLAVGLVFLLLPTGKKEEPQPPTEAPAPTQTSLEERLEEILSQVQGAGSVRVLLTCRQGETNIYQSDTQEQMDGERREIRQETVTVTGSDRNQTGLLSRVEAPVYRGAVVVCQGGDNPAVRLWVVEAVSGATGLPSNRITVLKMK